MCGRNSPLPLIAHDDRETRFDAAVVTDGGYPSHYTIAPGDGLEAITNEVDDEIDRYHRD